LTAGLRGRVEEGTIKALRSIGAALVLLVLLFLLLLLEVGLVDCLEVAEAAAREDDCCCCFDEDEDLVVVAVALLFRDEEEEGGGGAATRLDGRRLRLESSYASSSEST